MKKNWVGFFLRGEDDSFPGTLSKKWSMIGVGGVILGCPYSFVAIVQSSEGSMYLDSIHSMYLIYSSCVP